MKLMKRTGLIFVLLIFLSGCSEYQLSSSKKTTTIERVGENVFAVSFCGNAYMSQKEVEKYALQRASEEALSKGYAYFMVLKKQDESKMCTLNLKSPQASGTSGESRVNSTAYDFQPFVKPNIKLTVQCYRQGEKLPQNAIDAQNYLQENFPGLGK